MGQLSDVSIVKEISVDKEHIDNFILESPKGTKKLRDKFHKNACIDRNNYVDKQKRRFKFFSKKIYYELNARVDKYFPKNCTDLFDERSKKIEKFERLVIEGNDKLCVSTKLGIDFLIQEISETFSLEELNTSLGRIIDIFKKTGITLTIDDFSYTMFTREYMEVFLKNYGSDDLNMLVSDTFQKVYFECPKIIMQLKMNLSYLCSKYRTDLETYMVNYLNGVYAKEDLDTNKAILKYLDAKNTFLWDYERDAYNNLKLFLDKIEVIDDYLPGAFLRNKNFDLYVAGCSYDGLNEDDKNKFNNVIKEFHGVLNELKEYYRYEVILKNLISRYKDKEKYKSTFDLKQKEIAGMEKERLKLLKKYQSKPSLFNKIDNDKRKIIKMQINEELVKLDIAYKEMNDAIVGKMMMEKLNDAASIYDLFSCALYSFDYIESKFIKAFGEEEGFSLEEEFKRYIRFLYNLDNDFLRKINGLVQYNVTSVIADKYKILGLNIEVEDITKEKLDMTKKVVDYIVKALCIDEGDLSCLKMGFICRVKDILPLDGWEIVNEEII